MLQYLLKYETAHLLVCINFAYNIWYMWLEQLFCGSFLSACVKVVLYHHHLHQSQTVSQSDPRKLRSPTNICLIYMKRGGDKKRKGSKVQLENTILIQTWNFCSWLFFVSSRRRIKSSKAGEEAHGHGDHFLPIIPHHPPSTTCRRSNQSESPISRIDQWEARRPEMIQ